jgi:tryptophan halogenase
LADRRLSRSRFSICRQSAPEITLLESPEIGIIGVGEGAFPTIRTTLQFLGIDETQFIRATSATFKQGIRFDDWVHARRADGARQPLSPSVRGALLW